ncbi:MAG: SDR family oxidoreductase [Porphyromonadaceae bacterium]|nr:SDR family oxidoreductase [Porphyromonadaceae bacterium]
MKIIVTGSKGLIGTEVTRYLKEKHDVVEYDITLGHDLCSENSVRILFKNQADALVNLFAINDHVVNGRKAGIYDVTLESVNDYLQTNVTSLFSVCREYARNNKKGCIVNFASTYALNAPLREKHIGYTTSKAAVVMLTKHLAVELAPDIRVNCIAPGGVLNNQPEEFIKYYSEEVPLKRMMSKGELNKIVEYLCSDDSSYVTGSVFSIDGGWTAW